MTFFLQRITRSFRFRNVNDTVDIEGDFFRRGGPVLVTKAVDIFAIEVGIEGVVACRD